MARQLHAGEHIDLRDLRDFDVLQDIRWELVKLESGVCLLPCGDGDHFPQIFHWCEDKMLERGIKNPIIHPLSHNGGALLLPPDSPLNDNNRGANLLKDIEIPIEKGIRTLMQFSHAPCLGADKGKIGIMEQIRLHKVADTILQETYPQLQVLCFFHVYWGDRKRIYFVSGERWRAYQRLHMLM